MKNCGESPDKLQQLIKNILDHYKMSMCMIRIGRKCTSKPYFGISVFIFTSCISAIQYYYAIQGIRTNCPETSSCHATIYMYSPGKELLTDPKAEAALLRHLGATYIYREAQYFCHVSF